MCFLTIGVIAPYDVLLKCLTTFNTSIASTTDLIFANDLLVFPILPHVAQYGGEVTDYDHKRIPVLNLQISFSHIPIAIRIGNFEINIQRCVCIKDNNLTQQKIYKFKPIYLVLKFTGSYP